MRALATSICVVFCLFAAELSADCTFGFLTPTTYLANPKPGDVTTGDFNRDGFVDVVVNNRTMSEITLLPGTAGGGFGSPVTIPTDYTQGDIHAADFNNDGKLDLTFAVPWSNNFTVSPHLQVLLGNGNGTFTAVAYTPQQLVFQNPARMVLGDFNKDGKMDAATTRDDGKWSAMQNVGGFFATKAEYTTAGSWASGIAKGDFDGDGNADIAVSERVSKKVYLWFGNGDGTFTPGGSTIDLPHPDREPVDVQSGDFNHDGKDDLAILINGSGGGDNPHGPLKIALSSGASRTFATPTDFGQLPYSQEMMVRDIDSDGNPDVLIAGLQGGLTIFRGIGDGTFLPSQTYGTGAWLGLAVDDFDGDGGLDVVTTKFSAGSVGIYLNTCGHASLSLDSSINPAPQGTPVTVTGTVAPPPAVAPTGTITLKRGTTILRSGSLTAGMTLQSTMSDLTPGTYAFTFEYSGDARFIAMTKTLQQIVTVPPFGPPPGLNAISYGGPVQLAWIATTNTDHYEVWRNNGAGWVFA
ncbi:MAG: VCBS repeat-containing protein, partial [Acidobacteria bacterium]|nr:VCBS repeat-containing protein [Acidobacteriota bacterium]